MPLFLNQREQGFVTVTDERMTRFWITLEQGVRFVMHCIELMHGGEVFVPKIPSMRIVDLVDVVAPGCEIRDIGIRPGEKLHEVLISEDEARQTLELDDMYIVQPSHPWWTKKLAFEGQPLPEGYRYASDTNTQWLSSDELRQFIESMGITL